MYVCLQKCEIVLYADDTLIFNISETDEECQINLLLDVNNVNKQLKINKLKLNEDKRKIIEIYMILYMEINNKIIEKVEQLIIYHGFIIDNGLNCNDHTHRQIIFFKKIAKKKSTSLENKKIISILTAINMCI